MERLRRTEKRGLRKHQLLFWGMMFVLAGLFSFSFIQNRVLQTGAITTQQLLEIISSSQSAMAAATAALVMQALETCAIPIFAFLLVEGFVKGKSRIKMAFALLLTAAVSEIPYNLCMSGKLLDMSSRNPVIALVLGVAVMYFFRRYSEKSMKDVLIKGVVCISSLLWAVMLNVTHGVALLVMIMTFWALRNKQSLRTLVGAVVSSACMVISPFYIVSAMGILPVHLYREEDPEEQEGNPVVMYATYPVLLLTVGVLAKFL